MHDRAPLPVPRRYLEKNQRHPPTFSARDGESTRDRALLLAPRRNLEKIGAFPQPFR